MNGRMQIASVMADEVSTNSGEPAETEAPPVGKHNVAPDDELINLKISRKRMKIGPLTAAGVVFLSFFFLLKLNPDRKFAGNGDTPAQVSIADLASGKVEPESF